MDYNLVKKEETLIKEKVINKKNAIEFETKLYTSVLHTSDAELTDIFMMKVRINND